MSLAKELAAARAAGVRKSVPGCSTCQWIAAQSEAAQRQIREWIEDGNSVAELHRVLAKWGLPTKISAFKEHVKRCAKDGVD